MVLLPLKKHLRMTISDKSTKYGYNLQNAFKMSLDLCQYYILELSQMLSLIFYRKIIIKYKVIKVKIMTLIQHYCKVQKRVSFMLSSLY